MHVCKSLKRRVTRIVEQDRKYLKDFSKTHINRLSLITQFKSSFYHRLPVVEMCLEKCLISTHFRTQEKCLTCLNRASYPSNQFNHFVQLHKPFMVYVALFTVFHLLSEVLNPLVVVEGRIFTFFPKKFQRYHIQSVYSK